MGERPGDPDERSNVHNDISGTVTGPVGQFGAVLGDVHMHWSGEAKAEYEYGYSGDDDGGDDDTGSGLLRAAGICLALATASAITFGIITGQWTAPIVLSAAGAVVLYRWITPSGYDSTDDGCEEEPVIVQETWETWEEYSEHWEWQTWEEN